MVVQVYSFCNLHNNITCNSYHDIQVCASKKEVNESGSSPIASGSSGGWSFRDHCSFQIKERCWSSRYVYITLLVRHVSNMSIWFTGTYIPLKKIIKYK